tara:strand:- start:550 stop:1107 length:558 start_codon:yes stop_codon:yes gene_type:complete
MKNRSIAFVDIETTGLNPAIHEIIEIAIITADETYHTKIAPQRIDLADSRALQINKYNPSNWADAPSFDLVHQKITRLLIGKTIAGHNPKFDVEFLNEAFASVGSPFVTGHRVLDTITLAYEHLYPLGLKSLSLDAIRIFLNWDRTNAHTALQDCKDTKRLFDYLLRFGIVERSILKFKRRFFNS